MESIKVVSVVAAASGLCIAAMGACGSNNNGVSGGVGGASSTLGGTSSSGTSSSGASGGANSASGGTSSGGASSTSGGTSSGGGSADAGTDAAAGAGDPGDAGAALTCDVRDYGAKGNGTTVDTVAIQAAIDACAARGGGTVFMHGGRFLSGMISLKSKIVLDIDPTATLLGTQSVADYPDTNPPTVNTQRSACRKALVYAESVDGVRIEGGGTIDGQGGAGSPWSGTEPHRPMPIFTVLSTHVTIQNITIKDGAMWDLVSMEDDDLTITGVTINSLSIANRDGIDIVDCHHVKIDHCNIHSGDDAICIKSGIRRGVDDVTVTNSVAASVGANGLKLGTGSYGAFTNITFDTVTVNGANKAAMAIESVDGADVKNIVFSNITFQKVGAPVFILLGDRGPGSGNGWPSNDVHKVGSLDTVRFDGITGSMVNNAWGSLITGTGGERLKNIVFNNVHVTTRGGVTTVPVDPGEYTRQYPEVNMFGNEPAFGYFIRHADTVTFTGSTIAASPTDVRQAIESRDVTGLTIK